MRRYTKWLLVLALLVVVVVLAPLPGASRAQEAGELLIIKVVCKGEGIPTMRPVLSPEDAAAPPSGCTPADGLRSATFHIFDAVTGDFLVEINTDNIAGAVSLLLNTGTYEIRETNGVMTDPLRVRVNAGATTAIQAIDFTQRLITTVCASDRPGVQSGNGALVTPGGPLLNWRLPTPAGVQGSQVAVVGNQVIVALADRSNGALLSLNRETGAEQWCVDLADPPSGTPVIDGEVVIIPLSMSAAGKPAATIGIDLANGSVRWEQPFTVIGLSSASVSDGVAFAYALSGPEHALIAFDTATGTPRWRFTMATRWTGASNPVANNGTVYFAATMIDSLTGDLMLVALDAEQSRERWRTLVGYFGRAGTLTLDGSTLYLGSTFEEPLCCVTAFDSETGLEQWRVSGIGMDGAHLTVSGELLYAGGAAYETGVLVTLDATYGGEYWRISMGGEKHIVQSSPVVTQGQLIVVEPIGVFSEATLVSLDAISGSELWRLGIGGYEQVSPVAIGSDLYLTTDAVLSMSLV